MNGPDFGIWCITGLTVLLALSVYIHWLRTQRREAFSKTSLPTFDAWVDYCFTQGEQDFHAGAYGPDHAAAQARSAPFLNIDPPVLADYIITLFENPEFIANQ